MTSKSLLHRANLARKASNPHLGADFDDFLREEGLYDEAQAIAVKRVRAAGAVGERVKISLVNA